MKLFSLLTLKNMLCSFMHPGHHQSFCFSCPESSALYLSYQNEVKQNRKRAKTFISEILLTAEKNTNLLKGFCPIFPIKQKGDVPAVLLQASLQHVRFAGHHTVINAEPLSRSGKLTAAESPEPGAYGSVPQAEVLL